MRGCLQRAEFLHEQALRKDAKDLSPWLCRMITQGKPRLVVAVALANRMARMAWVLIDRETDYDPTMSPVHR